jgi:hypothetical protein
MPTFHDPVKSEEVDLGAPSTVSGAGTYDFGSLPNTTEFNWTLENNVG